MKGNDLLLGMSYIDERFIDEAETETIRKETSSVRWMRYGVLAACFVIMIILVASVLPNIISMPNTMPLDSNIADNGNNAEKNTVSGSEIHFNMHNIFLNEIDTSYDIGAARQWYDPELYDEIIWDEDEIFAYYGTDLNPSYIPEGLFPADWNGTARVFAEKNGKIVEDMVWVSYYHAYYEDGSPMLTEDVAAIRGFAIKASKIGLINECLYILPENEVKTSDIGGIEVTFGYRLMPYGPYDPDTHEPSGYYDLYVAEFTQDGIEYYIVTEQIEIEELVKVVSSIIYGEIVTIDK